MRLSTKGKPFLTFTQNSRASTPTTRNYPNEKSKQISSTMDPPVANNHAAMQKPSPHHTNKPSATADHDEYINQRVYTLILSLESQLISQEKYIATLEKKIANMTLELASAKATEDVQRSERQVSSTGDTESMSLENWPAIRNLLLRDGCESTTPLHSHPSCAHSSGTHKNGVQQQCRNGSGSGRNKPLTVISWSSQNEPPSLTDDSLKSSITSGDSWVLPASAAPPNKSPSRRRGSSLGLKRFFRRNNNFTGGSSQKLNSFGEDKCNIDKEDDGMMGMQYRMNTYRASYCSKSAMILVNESRMQQ